MVMWRFILPLITVAFSVHRVIVMAILRAGCNPLPAVCPRIACGPARERPLCGKNSGVKQIRCEAGADGDSPDERE